MLSQPTYDTSHLFKDVIDKGYLICKFLTSLLIFYIFFSGKWYRLWRWFWEWFWKVLCEWVIVSNVNFISFLFSIQALVGYFDVIFEKNCHKAVSLGLFSWWLLEMWRGNDDQGRERRIWHFLLCVLVKRTIQKTSQDVFSCFCFFSKIPLTEHYIFEVYSRN